MAAIQNAELIDVNDPEAAVAAIALNVAQERI